jgi:hypothetical protein
MLVLAIVVFCVVEFQVNMLGSSAQSLVGCNEQ